MNIGRNAPRWKTITGYLMLLGILVMVPPAAMAQDETATTTGTIASSSNNTITVKRANGPHQLFIVDRLTRKPAQLPVGTRVRVTSVASDDPGARLAIQINTVDGAATANQTTPDDSEIIPAEVRRIERDIERQARRLQLGVRAGMALDPELVMIGAQVQVGPFFSDNLFFRPNIEFAFGEVTSMFALNTEMVYRLPVTTPRARWSAYVGAGPGFNLIQQSFNRMDGSGRRIDFGEFKGDVAFNILGGVRYRNGMFTEMRTSVYSRPSPTLRLVIGYNF